MIATTDTTCQMSETGETRQARRGIQVRPFPPGTGLFVQSFNVQDYYYLGGCGGCVVGVIGVGSSSGSSSGTGRGGCQGGHDYWRTII